MILTGSSVAMMLVREGAQAHARNSSFDLLCLLRASVGDVVVENNFRKQDTYA